MRMKLILKVLACQTAALFLFTLPADARTFTTPEDILSIEAPTEDWDEVKKSTYWFEMTDGDSILTISHLSRGEALPSQLLANNQNTTAMQLLISTPNEVFVVNATTTRQDHLQELVKALGSIKVLKYNTLTAIETEAQTQETTEKASDKASSDSQNKKSTSKKKKQKEESQEEESLEEEEDIYEEEYEDEDIPDEEYLYDDYEDDPYADEDDYYDYDYAEDYDYDYSYDYSYDAEYDAYGYEDGYEDSYYYDDGTDGYEY